MKRIISLVLALSLVFAAATAIAADGDLKIGVILIHDENTGYDFAHIRVSKRRPRRWVLPLTRSSGNTTLARTRTATIRRPTL